MTWTIVIFAVSSVEFHRAEISLEFGIVEAVSRRGSTDGKVGSLRVAEILFTGVRSPLVEKTSHRKREMSSRSSNLCGSFWGTDKPSRRWCSGNRESDMGVGYTSLRIGRPTCYQGLRESTASVQETFRWNIINTALKKKTIIYVQKKMSSKSMAACVATNLPYKSCQAHSVLHPRQWKKVIVPLTSSSNSATKLDNQYANNIGFCCRRRQQRASLNAPGINSMLNIDMVTKRKGLDWPIRPWRAKH